MLSVLSDREDCTQNGHSPRSVVQPFTYVGTHQPVWTGATGEKESRHGRSRPLEGIRALEQPRRACCPPLEAAFHVKR